MSGVKNDLPPKTLPRAVVFDLDGTLVDSVPDLQAALNWLLPRFGRRTVSRDEVTGMVGDGVPKLVERGFLATGGLPEDGLDGPIAEFTGHYEANAAALTAPFPGAVRALEVLRDAGCLLAVCTNKPAGATAEILEALDLAPFFAAVAGGALWKIVVITRACYQQGFALPKMPRRGSGRRASPARLGGL